MADDDHELREFLARTVSDMVAIPSPSGREAAMADYVFARLKGAGVSPERDEDDNVWIEVGSGQGRLHVNAHMDTVVPVDGWSGDPFKPRIEGDRLYGLGAADCKGGLAAMLALVPRIRPRVRVLFSFTVCEEGYNLPKPNGSEKMAARGGDWAIVCEPTCKAADPQLGIGTQGAVRIWVTFRGRAAHSSRPEAGENAISAAARFCTGIDELNDSFTMIDLGGGCLARPSAAATEIAGGRLSNIIPDKCEVTVSRRLAPGETIGTVEAEMARLLAGHKASYRFACDGDGTLTRPDGALKRAARAAAAETGTVREVFFRGRTDAVIYARHGMDTIMIGPGDDSQCHAPNEHLHLNGAVATVKLLDRLINSLPEGPRT